VTQLLVIHQSVLSTEYVQVDVTADGGVYDPTAGPVAMAFVVSGNPGSGDWNTGSWDVPTTGGYVAQCLVGPGSGGVALAPGTYVIWLKVTDNPEVPVRAVGLLVVE
jgi:hypothetical protein